MLGHPGTSSLPTGGLTPRHMGIISSGTPDVSGKSCAYAAAVTELGIAGRKATLVPRRRTEDVRDSLCATLEPNGGRGRAARGARRLGPRGGARTSVRMCLTVRDQGAYHRSSFDGPTRVCCGRRESEPANLSHFSPLVPRKMASRPA